MANTASHLSANVIRKERCAGGERERERRETGGRKKEERGSEGRTGRGSNKGLMKDGIDEK